MPAAANANEFPFVTVIGSPVHVPNRCLVGPWVSQISSPTIVQFPPVPFVHVAVEEFDVAAADALFHVIAVPPAVYPVPDSSVMSEVAVGAVVPSFNLLV
jgi:hypothetical protein